MVYESMDSRFQTTLWSVVLRAGIGDHEHGQAALARLCSVYWKPLFVYCLGKGMKVQDAEDLTQSFFAWMVSRETLRVADPERGRFRSFLLTSFRNFISDEWDRASAIRRGGGAVHLSLDLDFRNFHPSTFATEASPEVAYDKQWAMDLTERATQALRAEYVSAGKGDWFDQIAGSSAGASYVVVAAGLGTTEEAVKSFAKRVRRRFRDILEREIADTVGSPEEAKNEMAYLVELLRG